MLIDILLYLYYSIYIIIIFIQQGQEEIARLFRRIAKEAKPFCTINAEVVSMTMMGFIAVVHTIETIEAGYAFKVVKRKGQTLVSDTLKKSAQVIDVIALITTSILKKISMLSFFISSEI